MRSDRKQPRSSIQLNHDKINNAIATAFEKLGLRGQRLLAIHRELWALREFSGGLLEQAYDRLLARQAAGKLDRLDRSFIISTLAELIGLLPRSIQTTLSVGMANIDQEYQARGQVIDNNANLSELEKQNCKKELVDSYVEKRLRLQEQLELECDPNAMTRYQALLHYVLVDYYADYRNCFFSYPSTFHCVSERRVNWFYEQEDSIELGLKGLSAACGMEIAESQKTGEAVNVGSHESPSNDSYKCVASQLSSIVNHIADTRGKDFSLPTALRKRTQKGAARFKIESAFVSHHKYHNRSIGNSEPITVSDLARMAGVAKSSASDFFQFHFGSKGHKTYRADALNERVKLFVVLAQIEGDPILPMARSFEANPDEPDPKSIGGRRKP